MRQGRRGTIHHSDALDEYGVLPKRAFFRHADEPEKGGLGGRTPDLAAGEAGVSRVRCEEKPAPGTSAAFIKASEGPWPVSVLSLVPVNNTFIKKCDYTSPFPLCQNCAEMLCGRGLN